MDLNSFDDVLMWWFADELMWWWGAVVVYTFLWTIVSQGRQPNVIDLGKILLYFLTPNPSPFRSQTTFFFNLYSYGELYGEGRNSSRSWLPLHVCGVRVKNKEQSVLRKKWRGLGWGKRQKILLNSKKTWNINKRKYGGSLKSLNKLLELVWTLGWLLAAEQFVRKS